MKDLRKRGHKPPVIGPWRMSARITVAFLEAPLTFGCVKHSPGLMFCATWHRTAGASQRHCEKLNRKEARAAK